MQISPLETTQCFDSQRKREREKFKQKKSERKKNVEGGENLDFENKTKGE